MQENRTINTNIFVAVMQLRLNQNNTQKLSFHNISTIGLPMQRNAVMLAELTVINHVTLIPQEVHEADHLRR
jgi:phosphatidylserine synthase